MQSVIEWPESNGSSEGGKGARKEIKKVKKEKMKAVCTLIKQYITAYGEREIKVA